MTWQCSCFFKKKRAFLQLSWDADEWWHCDIYPFTVPFLLFQRNFADEHLQYHRTWYHLHHLVLLGSSRLAIRHLSFFWELLVNDTNILCKDKIADRLLWFFHCCRISRQLEKWTVWRFTASCNWIRFVRQASVVVPWIVDQTTTDQIIVDISKLYFSCIEMQMDLYSSDILWCKHITVPTINYVLNSYRYLAITVF